MSEPAMLSARVDEISHPGLADPSEPLNLWAVYQPPEAWIDIDQAMHSVHDDPIACSQWHCAPTCLSRMSSTIHFYRARFVFVFCSPTAKISQAALNLLKKNL